MGKLSWGRRTYALLFLCAATAAASPAQTFTTLNSFNDTDGAYPEAALVQATNGDFYGTTYGGGANDEGTVFTITPSGTLTTLYSFCSQSNCTDGANPYAGLVQATNGDLYGTTYSGGANNLGTVFKITLSGTLITLHSFDLTDGAYPEAALIQATNGDLYGTTSRDGFNGYGTVFKITPSGKLTTLHSFDYFTDGAYPEAGLVQASNGDLYGTTSLAGANNFGTVFKITPSGTLTTLHSFGVAGYPTDGAFPEAGLVQASNGDLYGTTSQGAAYDHGTVFKITPSGTLTTLYSFCSQSNCTDGAKPYAGLVQATNGDLYGTTYEDGAHNFGTVFSLSVGLGPFVETRPASGKEGAKIGILGQGFSSSSVVKFGGTKATTIVLSGTTFITATVPAGALTGSVKVTTGTTTLTSAKTFKVLPTITSFTPASGPVGTSVTITGTGLQQATRVTFEGKSATFTVISDSEVTAEVPTGAATGKIAVTTKGGSATSATSFTVN
jgi:uncharacterized repeat protein (TIGR03803 family)